MENKFGLIVVAVLSFTACNTSKESISNSEAKKEGNIGYNNTSAIYWQQNSAEYEALCYQAFNIAAIHLKDLANQIDPTTGISKIDGDASKPMAIVMDLDETVLDNSLYSGYLLKNNLEDSEREWLEWSNKASAELIPGAKEFIDKVNRVNIPIFYITNRTYTELANLIQNLTEKGIPVDPNRILAKRSNEFKFIRRNSVAQSFNIVMFIGDNLSDFNEVYESDINLVQRKEITQSFQEKFGRQFIILPNILYGDWELKETSKRNPAEMIPVKNIEPYIKSYK